MMAISDAPWSNFSDGDYSDAQYARACLVDRGPDAGTPKQRYSLRVREPSGVINRNGVHAAAGRISQVRGATAEQIRSAARALVRIYRDDLGEEPPPALLELAGMAAPAARAELPARSFRGRMYELADAHIRSDGSGRMVEAYITPFDRPTEIHDEDGHYEEVVTRGAFNQTLARRGLDFTVLYNHGRTYDGRTDGTLMVPVGVPRLIEPREHGLYSETEYLDNPLADTVLDGIKKGAIRGYSFQGRFIKSSRIRDHNRAGGQLITRSEVAMWEYGPVLKPAYEEANIVGTRMADWITELDSGDVDRLREILGVPTDAVVTPEGVDLRQREPVSRSSALAFSEIRVGRMRRRM
jgi:HK97 family phage prohead protease